MANNVIEEESILNSVKRLLGIIPDITAFDQDITIHINTVFSILTQMGVGPSEGFKIISSDTMWSEFMSNLVNPVLYEDVKTFMYMRVKMMFDPPTNSALIESYNKIINELEYRLYTQSGGY